MAVDGALERPNVTTYIPPWYWLVATDGEIVLSNILPLLPCTVFNVHAQRLAGWLTAAQVTLQVRRHGHQRLFQTLIQVQIWSCSILSAAAYGAKLSLKRKRRRKKSPETYDSTWLRLVHLKPRKAFFNGHDLPATWRIMLSVWRASQLVALRNGNSKKEGSGGAVTLIFTGASVTIQLLLNMDTPYCKRRHC